MGFYKKLIIISLILISFLGGIFYTYWKYNMWGVEDTFIIEDQNDINELCLEKFGKDQE